jgi:DNA-binding transcriptional regulator LsrR (DeoR family)
MASFEQLKLMHLAAKMYYEEDKTQDEIAKVLEVSRPTVSRLLRQARDEGLVHITVLDPFTSVDSVANLLEETLGLSTALVVTGAGEAEAQHQIRKRIGLAAARYLSAELRPGDMLGIGWGRTLREVATALESQANLALTVVPLMGGLGQISPSFQVHELGRVFAERLGGVWQALYVPAIVTDDIARRSLLASDDVAQVIRTWDQLNVVVVGIGNLHLGSEVQMLFADYLDSDTLRRLEQRGAVGDICMHFFDSEGRPIVDGLPGVISIELDQLSRVRRRVGVAGGAEKAEAILGAVRGGYINYLITDESAALRMLELVNGDKA